MNFRDFKVLAQAVWLYHQQGCDLFSGNFIAEKLGRSEVVIRASILEMMGTSPEKLTQILAPERIKKVINASIAVMKKEAAPPSLVQMEVMDEEFLKGEKELNYRFAETYLGDILIASAAKGVCYLAFSDEKEGEALQALKNRFPSFQLTQKEDHFQQQALGAFDDKSQKVQLYLKATAYQLKAWKKMLGIPPGSLMSYSALVGNKKESHAFGAAVGSNPIAYLIPCHRMVPATGEIGNYHWGTARKAVLICLEAMTSSGLK